MTDLRIPLAADLETRDGDISRDQIIKNGVVESDGESTAAVKRPGASSLGTLGAMTAQGMGAFGNKLKVVAGDAFKEVTTTSGSVAIDASTALSPAFPGLDFSTQVSSQGANNVMMIKSGKEAWIYKP